MPGRQTSPFEPANCKCSLGVPLKRVAQRKLDLAIAAKAAKRADRSKTAAKIRRCIQTRARQSELRRVGDVEHLAPELDAVQLV